MAVNNTDVNPNSTINPYGEISTFGMNDLRNLCYYGMINTQDSKEVVHLSQSTEEILTTWIESDKNNINLFFSMIESTNNQVKQLMDKKVKDLGELNKATLMFKTHAREILVQSNDMKKVFSAASLKNVWNHFTKNQRKNIELWKMQITHILDEMDLIEDEEENYAGLDISDQDINKLKEENEALRRQVKAIENEQKLLQDQVERELDMKEREIQALISANDSPGPLTSTTWSGTNLSESDALLISRLANFFIKHPWGANILYICSYLQQIDSTINESDVIDLMTRFPDLYEEFLTGIGASLERRWKFIGFQAFNFSVK